MDPEPPPNDPCSRHERATDFERFGFRRENGVWRQDDVLLHERGRWITLETECAPPRVPFASGNDGGENAAAAAPNDCSRAGFGHPGFWKEVNRPNLGARVFDLPASRLAETGGTSAADDPGLVQACLQWAMATRTGRVPEGWSPPARALIESWIPKDALSLLAGPHARQGELIHTIDRLAVRFPVLLHVPRDLTALRRRWLGELVAEAQSRWRLARFGFVAGAQGDALLAEVDFTGAPAEAIERLISAGIDALKWVVAWLLPGADFVADATVASRALEAGASKPATPERS